MAFNINFWKVEKENIVKVERSKLNTEERLETWIENDPSFLGIDLLIIGRQVTTAYRARIDILGINSDRIKLCSIVTGLWLLVSGQ